MYVKLGKNAESFSDPVSGFDISGKEVKELTAKEKSSLKIRRALTGGHLAHASKDEFKEFEEEVKRIEKKVKVGERKFPGKESEKIKELEEEVEDLEGQVEDLEDENTKLKGQITTLKEQLSSGGTGGNNKINYDDFENKVALIQHYKDNYEVTEDDIKAFSKKNRDDMIAELKDLEDEN